MLLDTPTAAGVKTWRDLFETYLRQHVPLTLLRDEATELTSRPGEGTTAILRLPAIDC